MCSYRHYEGSKYLLLEKIQKTDFYWPVQVKEYTPEVEIKNGSELIRYFRLRLEFGGAGLSWIEQKVYKGYRMKLEFSGDEGSRTVISGCWWMLDREFLDLSGCILKFPAHLGRGDSFQKPLKGECYLLIYLSSTNTH